MATATESDLYTFDQFMKQGNYADAARVARGLGFADNEIAQYVASKDYGMGEADALSWLQGNPTYQQSQRFGDIGNVYSGSYDSRVNDGNYLTVNDDAVGAFNHLLNTGDTIGAYALAEDYGFKPEEISQYITTNRKDLTDPKQAQKDITTAGEATRLLGLDPTQARTFATERGWTPEFFDNFSRRMGFGLNGSGAGTGTSGSGTTGAGGAGGSGALPGTGTGGTGTTGTPGGLGTAPIGTSAPITTQQAFRDQLMAGQNQNSIQQLGGLMSGLRNQYISGQTPALGGVTTAYQRDVAPTQSTPSTWMTNQPTGS